ncbi:MAG TPA: CoA-acylating methylmalonate-semialdehyde dehydrogenase [Actinomycetota bacterium]|jgi:malonate-semialdehyde dehydrogenase (acetylating)/methylmalonate-semialdehyde dehydrogenase|nr:CoA-acylating methylmalonate-semialdehyde dehydrogenase [Actinomycetota bacterium]
MSAERVPALIGGRFQESGSDEVDPIYDPATGETIALLPYSTPEEIDRAVGAAAEAFPAWADTPVPERAQVMFRFKALLEDLFEDLSRLVTHENGKTLAEARGEVRRAIEVVELACGAPTLMMGTNLDQIADGIDEELVRFPVGVVAGITPFNFPNMVPLWMIPLAIVCGNTFVHKPSQRTPLSAIRIAELLTEAGVPDGVFNVVHGAKDSVDALLGHPDVAAVSFVGSAGVAAYIYSTGAANGKRVQALGGAKNHLLVMDDADLDKTVTALLSSAFGNAGQRCLAGSVAVGVGSLGDALVQELSDQAGRLKVGPGMESDTDMGPVIREERRKELIGYIEQGEEVGATLVSDGRGVGPSEGFFLGPTIFDRVTPDMALWRDELFGPVLSVVRASDIDEALDILNASSYGNAASIFTTSGANARAFKRRAEAGMLGVNIGVAAPMAFFPFTGWKSSFFGDLHATGKDGVRFYTRHKVVTSRWWLPEKLDHTKPEGRGH